ncbi:MAG: DCC1-like thiol-disulfide oxidoreductase family protein [Nitrososphaerales archaeon]
MLAYDSTCGSCSRFKSIVQWFDKYHRLEFVSISKADTRGYLDTIPNSKRRESFHLIIPYGTVKSGAIAIPDLLALLPIGKISSFLISNLPFTGRVISFLYSTFSRLHQTCSCALQPQAKLVISETSPSEEEKTFRQFLK